MLGSKTTYLHIAHCHVHNQLVVVSLLSIRAQNTPAVASRRSQAYFHHLALLYFTTMSTPWHLATQARDTRFWLQ